MRGTFYLSATEVLEYLQTKQAKAHAWRERFTFLSFANRNFPVFSSENQLNANFYMSLVFT